MKPLNKDITITICFQQRSPVENWTAKACGPFLMSCRDKESRIFGTLIDDFALNQVPSYLPDF